MSVPEEDGFLFSAKDMLAYRKRLGVGPNFAPPTGTILCLQSDPLKDAAKRYRGRRKRGFMADFYLLKRLEERVGLAGNFGVGAPVTAALVEELAAFGVKRFVLVGICGGIGVSSRAGDLIIVGSAIRDEGTSAHYLPPSREVSASPALVLRLEQALAGAGHAYAVGKSWTTDAPYRERLSDLVRHRRDGALAVEMEAAGLYAAARELGVAACATLVVGDTISGSKWRLDHDQKLTRDALRTVVDASVKALVA
jgi:uridine phosphorylase